MKKWVSSHFGFIAKMRKPPRRNPGGESPPGPPRAHPPAYRARHRRRTAWAPAGAYRIAPLCHRMGTSRGIHCAKWLISMGLHPQSHRMFRPLHAQAGHRAAS